MKIKSPERIKGAHITPPAEPINYDARPPIFSLEKLVAGKYCLSAMEQADKALFAEAIYRRRNLTWAEIRKAGRHGLGVEKIARTSIKTAMPAFVTADVDDFLAFRFSGLKPMVGYRVRDIFYVIWFDNDFTLYDH